MLQSISRAVIYRILVKLQWAKFCRKQRRFVERNCCHVKFVFDIFYFFFKFCGKINDSNILIEDGESGKMCKISCPECEVETSLSSSVSSSTGKISFTIFNFRRHYLSCHDIEGSHGGECSKDKSNNQQELSCNFYYLVFYLFSFITQIFYFDHVVLLNLNCSQLKKFMS